MGNKQPLPYDTMPKSLIMNRFKKNVSDWFNKKYNTKTIPTDKDVLNIIKNTATNLEKINSIDDILNSMEQIYNMYTDSQLITIMEKTINYGFNYNPNEDITTNMSNFTTTAISYVIEKHNEIKPTKSTFGKNSYGCWLWGVIVILMIVFIGYFLMSNCSQSSGQTMSQRISKFGKTIKSLRKM